MSAIIIILLVLMAFGILGKNIFWLPAIGGSYLYLTKPKKETFEPYFQSLFAQAAKDKNASIGQRLFTKGLSYVITDISDITVEDYGLWQKATVVLPDKDKWVFTGINNNWYLRN